MTAGTWFSISKRSRWALRSAMPCGLRRIHADIARIVVGIRGVIRKVIGLRSKSPEQASRVRATRGGVVGDGAMRSFTLGRLHGQWLAQCGEGSSHEGQQAERGGPRRREGSDAPRKARTNQ